MIKELWTSIRRARWERQMARAVEMHNLGISSGATSKLIPFLLEGRELPERSEFARLADEGYRKNAIIYACVREISQTAAEPELLGLNVLPDGEEIPLERSHPLSRLLREPNADQDAFEFGELLVTQLQVAGNAFIWKIRPQPEAPPAAVELIRPDIVGILPGRTRAEGKVRAYTVDVNGEKFEIPARDIIHIKLPDPTEEFWGLSPIFVLARYGDIDAQATEFLRGFFLNRGIPAGLIKVNKVLQKPERERIKEQWKEQAQGLTGWHTVSVFDQDFTYQALATGLKDMELDPIFSQTEVRICMTYGVPPILIGAKAGLDRSTFSNFGEARSTFWTDTVLPMYTRIGGRLTRMLAVEFGEDLRIKYDTSNVTALQEDQESARKFALEGWNGGMLTRNQAFASVDMPEEDDGDVYKLSTTSVIVPREQVLDLAFLAGESIRDAAQQGRAEGEDEQLDEGQTVETEERLKGYIWEALKAMVAEGKLSLSNPAQPEVTQLSDPATTPQEERKTPNPFFREDTSAEWDAWWAEWSRKWLDEELQDIHSCCGEIRFGAQETWTRFTDDDADEPEWRLVHRRADARIRDLMDVVLKATNETAAQLDDQLFLNAIRDGDIDRALTAIDWQGVGGQIIEDELTPILQDLTNQVGQDSIGFVPASRLGEGVLFDEQNPRVQASLTNQIGNMISGLNSQQVTTLRRVVEDLTDGRLPFETAVDTIKQHVGLNTRQSRALVSLHDRLLEAGLSSDEISTALTKAHNQMIDFRAELIARTESINAASEGQRLSWIQLRDEGVLSDDDTRKFWVTTPDDRLDQAQCAPVPSLNPNGRRVDEPFVTPSGDRQSPTLHPLCRCSQSLVFMDVDGGFIGNRPGFDEDGNATDLDDDGRAVVDRIVTDREGQL